MEQFEPFIGICDFCYPNYGNEIRVASGLLDKDGNWIGGYTKEKHEKYMEFITEYQKDKLMVVVDIDSEFGTHVCLKHMLEIASSMAAMEQSELRKRYDVGH